MSSSLKNLLAPVLPNFPLPMAAHEVEILQELPIETLYLALKAADTENALWVFQNARPEQVQGLIDIDCWNGAEFLPERFTPFFKTLCLLDIPKFGEFNRWVDPEIIVRGLMEYVKVEDFDPQNPPPVPEDQLLVTLDSKYALILKNPSPDIREALYLWINKCSAYDLDLMRRHLESCKWEQISDLEEYAYQVKKGPIEELGFVEREEALALYARGKASLLKRELVENPLPAGAKREAAENNDRFGDGDHIPIQSEFLPTLFTQSSTDENFLATALSKVESKNLKLLIVMELVRTINASLSADELLHADLEKISVHSSRAKAYINLGLTYLSDGKLERATEFLESAPLFSIYRLGWLVVADLVAGAKEIKQSFNGMHLSRLESRLFDELSGRHPELSAELVEDLKLEAAPFALLRISNTFLVGERLRQLALLKVHFLQHIPPLGDFPFKGLMNALFRSAGSQAFTSDPLTRDEWHQTCEKFSAQKLQEALKLELSRAPAECQPFLGKRLQDLSTELISLVKNKSSIPDARFSEVLLFA